MWKARSVSWLGMEGGGLATAGGDRGSGSGTRARPGMDTGTDRVQIGRRRVDIEPEPGLDDLARGGVAGQGRQALRGRDQQGQVDASVVAHAFERMRNPFAADVATGPGCVGAAAEAAERHIEAGRAGID